MFSNIQVKLLSAAFFVVGIFAALYKFGSSMKKSGADSEKLKQQAASVVAYDKRKQKDADNAQIEIDNSQLTTSELHDSVWTKPDADS